MPSFYGLPYSIRKQQEAKLARRRNAGRAAMNRYFFDVVGYGRPELDYSGRILPTLDKAYDEAELWRWISR